jgi:hypothetical protein
VTDNKVNEGGKTGYKVGLVLTAGFGAVHIGPFYSILSQGPGETDTMTVEVESPVLGGTAKVIFGPDKETNNISLQAKFTGRYTGNSSGLFKLNWTATTK